MAGCTWVVGRVKKWNSMLKKYELAAVHCNKLPAPDSNLCPKHKLFHEHGEKEEPVAYAEGR
jgi:hypothetical protein